MCERDAQPGPRTSGDHLIRVWNDLTLCNGSVTWIRYVEIWNNVQLSRFSFFHIHKFTDVYETVCNVKCAGSCPER